jgi:hypothetical protein
LVGSKGAAAIESIATEALRRVLSACPEVTTTLAVCYACLVGHGGAIAIAVALKRTGAAIAMKKLALVI